MSELPHLERTAKSLRRLPPVHLWNPDYLGDIDMRIAADGRWFYQGGAIERTRMVRLFSTLLRKDEDGRTYLITPHEKYGIEIEDAPFLVVAMSVDGTGRNQTIRVTTNVGDTCPIDTAHPLRFARLGDAGHVKPYVTIRGRLEALFNRATFYELAELGAVETHDGTPWFGLWSGGEFWPAVPAEEAGILP